MDPLVAIAAKTAGRSPLGFDALAFPSDAMVSDTNQFQLFQGSAALFVHHLRLKAGGPVCLGALVLAFNRSLNWQTALLKTYQSEFQSLLDIEKWWAVTSVAFYAQNASRFITPDTLDRHLRAILQETVEVARSTNSPLGRRVLRLSETIEQWPFAAQAPVLERKLIQLRYLSGLGSRYLSRQGKRMRRLKCGFVSNRCAALKKSSIPTSANAVILATGPGGEMWIPGSGFWSRVLPTGCVSSKPRFLGLDDARVDRSVTEESNKSMIWAIPQSRPSSCSLLGSFPNLV